MTCAEASVKCCVERVPCTDAGRETGTIVGAGTAEDVDVGAAADVDAEAAADVDAGAAADAGKDAAVFGGRASLESFVTRKTNKRVGSILVSRCSVF